MQKAMRRAVGVGGAAAVAIAASLALAGVASAHVHNVSAQCVTDAKSANYGKSELKVSLTDYNDKPNSVVITNGATTLYQSNDFTPQYVHNFFEDGSTAQSYEVKVVANSKQYSFDSTVTTKPCPQPSTPPGTPTQPPTKPTTPPSTTPSAPSSSSAPTTTTPAVAPVANQTTPPAGGLAYTGVSTELPLIIAGALIIIGAAALIAMRIMKRRRAEN